jgi:hypothetical protein
MVLPRPTARIAHAAKLEFSSKDRSENREAGHSLEALSIVASERLQALLNMASELLDHRNHELINLPWNALGVADTLGVSIKLAAPKRLFDGRQGVGMLVTNKGRWHPVGTVLRAPRGPIGRSLEVR